MGMTENDYRHQVDALLPRGPLWKPKKGGVVDAVLYALSREAARIDARACAVIEEADPRTSYEELERWFADYGIPSECLAAIADPSLEQMRQELVAKITSNLGLTKAFFESLAGTLGFSAEVETYREHNVNDNAECPLYSAEWSTAMTLGVKVRGRNGAEEFNTTWAVDQPLARWGNSLLECVVRALAPAHVYVIFSYEDE